MWDQFGDGWSGAALLIQTPSSTSSPQRYAPSCDQNPLDISLCANPSDPSLWGVFNMSVYAPANTPDPWEIAWRVTVTNPGGSEGDYLGKNYCPIRFRGVRNAAHSG